MSQSHKPFVHLHLHTGYSLLDGACRVSQVMEHCLAHKMPAVAMTDHGVMYGIIDFYKQGRAKGVKPILGCETYVATGSRLDKPADEHSRMAHLVLLAETNEGYANLIRLISLAHLEGYYYKARVDKEILARHHKGIIALSACLKGEVAGRLADRDMAGALKKAGEYVDIFGKDNFFMEVMNHRLPEQQTVNGLLHEFSRKSGVKLVATNDVHYLKREHAPAHDVMLAMQTQTHVSDPGRLRYDSEEFYMKSRAEMELALPGFEDAIERTLHVSDRCTVEIEFDTLHFPTYRVEGGVSQKAYLVRLAHEGIRKHYGIPDPDSPRTADERKVMDRFHHELAIIEKTNFINYFLVVWDFVHFAKQQGIPVGPGRGSGGGSLMAYAMGITEIDPLRYGLIFERFLNPERVSPPDFDIDFCQSRRGEVITYVRQKYGAENVAQITTFGTLGARNVIKDVGRALEVPFAKTDQITKQVPEDPKMTLKKALEESQEFRHLYQSDADCQRILQYAFVLEGLPKNVSTHAAGVVIGEKPLIDLVPLYRDKEGQVVTQYSMEPLGEIGLLKMDFLGLKTLTVIREAVDLIQETRGITVDIDDQTFKDPATFELLSRGDTVAVFQLEGQGMRDELRRVGVNSIEDLLAMIALYRPGPMDNIPHYAERKHGRETVEYDHPLMEPLLKETYGIMVYQEQVQLVANVLAGYSLGQADILRRAMGKKKVEAMAKERDGFVAGCKKTHHIPEKLAGEIFDNMAKFAGYGFNKSHSAGYAVICYQTAYLKANYLPEFMAATISSEIGNSEKIAFLLAEVEEMGLTILPPDVNRSGTRFRPEGKDGVRFGLAGIRGVGHGAAEALVNERKQNGPFKSLIDFCCRVDSRLVNKKALESLVRCGAFDGMGVHRARMFNGIEIAMGMATRQQQDRKSGQRNLFGEDPGAGVATGEELPECPPWPESQMLASEKELLGTYMSGHPLTQFAHILKRYQTTTLPQIGTLEDHAQFRVGGILGAVNKKFNKEKKTTWAIIHLEGLDGGLEIFVYAQIYEKYLSLLVPNTPVLLCGEVRQEDGKTRILADEIYPLADAPRHFARRLGIHIPIASMDDGKLVRIHDMLRAHPGQTPVLLCLQYPAGEKVFMNTGPDLTVFPDAGLIRELEHEVGEHGLHVSVNEQPCRKERRYGGNGGGRNYSE